MESTCGRPYLGRYCCTKVGKVSFSSRRDFAAIVSSTSELFPEPETPVNTVIWYLGMSRETSFRLFSRAPRMRMMSLSCIFCVKIRIFAGYPSHWP